MGNHPPLWQFSQRVLYSISQHTTDIGRMVGLFNSHHH